MKAKIANDAPIPNASILAKINELQERDEGAEKNIIIDDCELEMMEALDDEDWKMTEFVPPKPRREEKVEPAMSKSVVEPPKRKPKRRSHRRTASHTFDEDFMKKVYQKSDL